MAKKSKEQWYVANTYAGHENCVKENLLCHVESMELQDYLLYVIVAGKEEIGYKDGRKVKKTTNLFSGYLFVGMIVTDGAQYIVRNMPGATGFIGPSGGGAELFPTAEGGMESILCRLGMNERKVQIDLAIRDRVRILSGASANVKETVKELHKDPQTTIVLATLFRHETSTEIGHGESEKVEL